MTKYVTKEEFEELTEKFNNLITTLSKCNLKIEPEFEDLYIEGQDDDLTEEELSNHKIESKDEFSSRL